MRDESVRGAESIVPVTDEPASAQQGFYERGQI